MSTHWRPFFWQQSLTVNFTLKEYFQQVVGPIKRSVITYGPNGQSRGIATIEFVKPQDAATAAQKYNGVEVDKRPMKVSLRYTWFLMKGN
jgi:RNA recognition motif-containing protein